MLVQDHLQQPTTVAVTDQEQIEEGEQFVTDSDAEDSSADDQEEVEDESDSLESEEIINEEVVVFDRLMQDEADEIDFLEIFRAED